MVWITENDEWQEKFVEHAIDMNMMLDDKKCGFTKKQKTEITKRLQEICRINNEKYVIK